MRGDSDACERALTQFEHAALPLFRLEARVLAWRTSGEALTCAARALVQCAIDGAPPEERGEIARRNPVFREIIED